jgi:hypothetical protein
MWGTHFPRGLKNRKAWATYLGTDLGSHLGALFGGLIRPVAGFGAIRARLNVGILRTRHGI